MLERNPESMRMKAQKLLTYFEARLQRIPKKKTPRYVEPAGRKKYQKMNASDPEVTTFTFTSSL